MKFNDVNIGDILLWQGDGDITIDKIIKIDKYIHIQVIKIIKRVPNGYYDYNLNEICSYDIELFESENFRLLTPLEKLKYL